MCETGSPWRMLILINLNRDDRYKAESVNGDDRPLFTLWITPRSGKESLWVVPLLIWGKSLHLVIENHMSNHSEPLVSQIGVQHVFSSRGSGVGVQGGICTRMECSNKHAYRHSLQNKRQGGDSSLNMGQSVRPHYKMTHSILAAGLTLWTSLHIRAKLTQDEMEDVCTG